MTDSTLRLQYVATNIQPPAGAIRAWGARAIFKGGDDSFIDLLGDRQDVAPDEPRLLDPACPEGKRAFAKWVDDVAMPWLRKHVKAVYLRSTDSEVVAHIDGQYAIVATPNRSFGYLYIAAWEIPMGMAHPVDATPTPPPPASSLPHEYVPNDAPWMSHYKHKSCKVCHGNKSDRRHKAAKPKP